MVSRHGQGSHPPVGTVLFVDDEAEVLEEFAELFELLGFDVCTSSSPFEALQMVLQDERIRVVVTDYRMAGLDGGALVRTLRKRLPHQRTVNFIILTGLGAGFRPEGLEDVPVLAKPFEHDQLLAFVRAGLAAA